VRVSSDPPSIGEYIVFRYTETEEERLLKSVDYRSLAKFRYEIRRFLNFSEHAARAADIEPQQHQALLVIKGHSPGSDVTVGTLAERLYVRHHTAVELTDRLESKGWIRRVRSRGDGRKVNLRLTGSGDRLIEMLSLSHQDELRILGPRLIAALRSVLANTTRARRKQRTKKRGR
jgi:DNA-binding MarR family transcriptional regulator